MSSFGDVRALLQRRAQDLSWRALIETLRAYPDPDELKREILPYCDQSLSRWPDAVRLAHPEWVDEALDRLDDPSRALHPGVQLARGLNLRARPDEKRSWLELFQAYDLSRLTALRLSGAGEKIRLPRKDLQKLLKRLETSSLTALCLQDVRLNARQWEALLAWPRLDALKTLQLERARLVPRRSSDEETSAPLATLLERKLPALKHLCLRDNKLRAGDIALLADSALSGALRTLRLGAVPNDPYHSDRHVWFNRVQQHGLELLCDAEIFPSLSALELSYHQLAEESDPLMRAEMPSLRALDLRHNYMRSPHGKWLAEAPFVERLEALDLSGNTVGAHAVRALIKHLSSDSMRELRLSRTNLGQRGFEALITSPTMRHLKRLELFGENIGVANAGRLAHASFERLEALNLLENALTSEGFEALQSASFASTLRELKLSITEDDAVVTLLEAPSLSALESLVIPVRSRHGMPGKSREARHQALREHPRGALLSFVREELYHYSTTTRPLITLPGEPC